MRAPPDTHTRRQRTPPFTDLYTRAGGSLVKEGTSRKLDRENPKGRRLSPESTPALIRPLQSVAFSTFTDAAIVLNFTVQGFPRSLRRACARETAPGPLAL